MLRSLVGSEMCIRDRERSTPGTAGDWVWPRLRVCVLALDTHSLLLSRCVHSIQRTRRCCGQIACYSALLLLLCDDGLMMAPKMLRLRSSSQMQDNTQGAAGGVVWLRPSVCVRAIGTRCRRGLNRQGSEVESLARVTPGCVRMRTDRQICIYQNRD